ncbi:unnamed protein product [Pieris macdunnoughi]|uniref:Uncharacterized protein n=1 Tax=Pieris macdunnoughi TaxID=345717 RepID=A0A821W9Y1_9NEOP|nr:unnamed protein product [Pieris macdunnoughi]
MDNDGGKCKKTKLAPPCLKSYISVPKTIGDRLKSTPAKHDSPVDSQKNTLLLSHDIQDMVNDRDDDDDVIIIDNVPESHFITITPNVALNTDDESNRTQRKKEICKVCYADVTRVDFIKHWDTHLDLNNLNRRLKSPEVLLPQLPHGFQTLDHDDTPDIKKALTEPLPHRERNTPNVLVADDAFPLSENIIKPYSCDLNRGSPKRVCNYRISRARRVVENKIGQEMHYFMSQLGSVPWQSAYL